MEGSMPHYYTYYYYCNFDFLVNRTWGKFSLVVPMSMDMYVCKYVPSKCHIILGLSLVNPPHAIKVQKSDKKDPTSLKKLKMKRANLWPKVSYTVKSAKKRQKGGFYCIVATVRTCWKILCLPIFFEAFCELPR